MTLIYTIVRYVLTLSFIFLSLTVTVSAVEQSLAGRFDWFMLPSVVLLWAMAYICFVILHQIQPPVDKS
jgi:hypothetical protein